jgi:hypothetical protein
MWKMSWSARKEPQNVYLPYSAKYVKMKMAMLKDFREEAT